MGNSCWNRSASTASTSSMYTCSCLYTLTCGDKINFFDYRPLYLYYRQKIKEGMYPIVIVITRSRCKFNPFFRNNGIYSEGGFCNLVQPPYLYISAAIAINLCVTYLFPPLYLLQYLCNIKTNRLAKNIQLISYQLS